MDVFSRFLNFFILERYTIAATSLDHGENRADTSRDFTDPSSLLYRRSRIFAKGRWRRGAESRAERAGMCACVSCTLEIHLLRVRHGRGSLTERKGKWDSATRRANARGLEITYACAIHLPRLFRSVGNTRYHIGHYCSRTLSIKFVIDSIADVFVFPYN